MELLALRTGLRRFLHWSEMQERTAGVTPAQHQLLLAVRGHPGRTGPTIGDVADSLFLRNYRAVELTRRAGASGFVQRHSDPHDGRVGTWPSPATAMPR